MAVSIHKFAPRFKALGRNTAHNQSLRKRSEYLCRLSVIIARARVPDSSMLMWICQKCGVSADWLLGLSDVKAPEADVKSACKATGLHENAGLSVNHMAARGRREILATLLEHAGFFVLTGCLAAAHESVNKKPVPMSEEQLQALMDVCGVTGDFSGVSQVYGAFMESNGWRVSGKGDCELSLAQEACSVFDKVVRDIVFNENEHAHLTGDGLTQWLGGIKLF